MIDYRPVTQQDIATLRQYYENNEYRLCEYSAGTKLMWRNSLHPAIAEAAGCLIAWNRIGTESVFDYPVPGAEGDVEAALDAIEADCMERGIDLVFSVIPEEKLASLLRRYPYAKISNVRTWQDYLYLTEDIQNFAGRRYAGQRNHIKKFYAAHPDAAFRPLTGDDAAIVSDFWADYSAEFTKQDDPKAVTELEDAGEMLKLIGAPWLRCGGMFDGGKLISLAIAEKCGDTMIIHIEKALYSYSGVYPATVQAFAKQFGGDVTYLNREDDAADRGLRTSKLQYGPTRLLAKYSLEAQTELENHVREIPTLTTERLTLSALTEADLPEYNALVLDKERNRWWGYDDVAGLKEPMAEDSFLKVAREDFRRGMAANFAVRLDGKLIGEAVLYNFNYRGGAELGCRIAQAYAGQGYGTEAFNAVAEWGLYRVHLFYVTAKCFKENESSRRMLSSCMRPDGEDETYWYFRKEV
jgi:RimJ/RimL family protein N-acetyltransferase